MKNHGPLQKVCAVYMVEKDLNRQNARAKFIDFLAFNRTEAIQMAIASTPKGQVLLEFYWGDKWVNAAINPIV